MKWLQMTLVAATVWALPAYAAPPPAPRGEVPPFPYSESTHTVDISPLVSDPRAYKRGFLSVGSGGFRWNDGARARFWGLNVANRNLWISHAEIDRIVDVLARSGVNLFRFEALDSRGGMLGAASGSPNARPGRIEPDKLDTVHYWMHRLRQKGIYYYLDLIDFREFQAEEGVENAKNLPRAGRPYCLFDDTLIRLQKSYAQQLLTTVNPYTHLRPVDDPGFAMMEICNESGFFLYAKATDNLIEPYRTDFQQRWNGWLQRKYRDHSALATAWGEALGPDEEFDRGTVRLPKLLHADAPARQRDGIEFLVSVQRAYFATMRDYLHSLGVKIPITAVVSSDVPADLYSVAAELDFLSENHYADHPAFGGTDWEGKFFYNNKNTLRESNRFAFAPFTAQLRWDSKPVVIREWASVWPNQYRASSVPEVAAYARMQDFDGMILFSYKTGAVADRLVEFGYQVDPAVWDLFAMGALLFLRGDVASSSQIAVLEYATERLYRNDLGVSDLVRLAFSQRLVSVSPQGRMPVGDLTIWPLREEEGQAGQADALLAQAQVLPGTNAYQAGAYTSLTGQLTRDVANGRLLINAPRVCMIAGELPADEIQVGPVKARFASPVGALVVISLDGEPLEQSKNYLVKMVTVAENTGQKLLPSAAGAPGAFVLDQPGQAPVVTFGAPSTVPTSVRIKDNAIIDFKGSNGTWELHVKGNDVQFWCDTPGISGEVLGRPFVTRPGGLQKILEPAR